jgi:hypothetical protein
MNENGAREVTVPPPPRLNALGADAIALVGDLADGPP